MLLLNNPDNQPAFNEENVPPGGYGNWLKSRLNSLSPQDLYLLHQGMSPGDLYKVHMLEDGITYPTDPTVPIYKR